MMTSDSPHLPRRRQDILERVRQRQALRRNLSGEEILEAEREIFAEDAEYVPQLLRNYAELLGGISLDGAKEYLSVPNTSTSLLPETIVSPARQRDDVLNPPVIQNKELTEFDKHHNAVRLYVIQQFKEGKKSREIAEMMGLTSNKLTRWYNQVKDLPAEMQLWTPLFKEEEVGEWNSETLEPELETAPVAPAPVSAAPRLVEPSREAVRAAKRALLQAAKNTQLERDQEAVRLWIHQNTVPSEDPAVASRLAALAFHRDAWSLSRIARALELDVSTVSRWMTRAKQAEQAEEALQKGMDKRRAELRLKAEQAAKAVRPGVRHQPRPKVALPRPITPLSPMAKRSVGMLQSLLEQAATENDGSLSLRVASAIERERVMAALSMLHVQPSRPLAQGSGFKIPLLPEEAKFFTRMLAQG